MPDSIFTAYEKKLLRQIVKAHDAIKGKYYSAIDEITFTASQYGYKGIVFDLNKYPRLKAKIDAKMLTMHDDIYTVIVNSINDSWSLSNKKNNIIVTEKLGAAKGLDFMFDDNRPALKQFLARKEKGLGLSRRIWRGLRPWQNELTQALAVGIAEGTGSKKMAGEVKKYLLEPDRLYRRVRDSKGILRLSAAAKSYHPGQGVYRSSYKNALRLTATETNMAFRSADHERWSANSDFIKGIEVRLSEQHPRFDICDHLVGVYPKDFEFIGWHVQCLCYAIPILTSDEDFLKQLDMVLGVGPGAKIDLITDIPKNAKQWMKDNATRVKGWANLPYFITQIRNTSNNI